ncbi:hypothetical protein QN277_005592 [Acacia crassicarpa]|uniref:THH1/TOM1/TOM3 domain-containing protein n=2 Tax=Acacia crassicarpa TaxID=499986 RepID=A0AAE1J003_9FABA|nr:hypothetical protein QN277_005592 [Acacia crassicarpa]
MRMFQMREDGYCFPRVLFGVIVGLALVDGIIAFFAYFQLIRIHQRNSQVGWSRQKVFHLMIGTSSLGFFFYFALTLLATCYGWTCWSHSCGFIFLALPKILFFAAFLLLLSFWVDLCHQPDDDDDYEGSFCEEALLRKSFNEAHSVGIASHRKWFPLRLSRLGNRQKIVLLVTLLVFVIMLAFAVIMWIGLGKNPIDSAVATRVYVDFFAVGMLILVAALTCYGILLCLKMSKVRAEQPSSEMYKVACLTVTCVLCFTSSALDALFTDIPMLYHWHPRHVYDVCSILLLILYYFVGSSIPSAMLLWVMRESPPAETSSTVEEPSTLAFVGDNPVIVQNPQRWTTATSMQNQALRVSPI